MRNHDHVLSLLTGLFFERYVPAVEVCVTTACCSDNTAYHGAPSSPSSNKCFPPPSAIARRSPIKKRAHGQDAAPPD
eukprot:COSAG01_NODE_261_length_20040_cov_33.761496_17_plen_77_part_00